MLTFLQGGKKNVIGNTADPFFLIAWSEWRLCVIVFMHITY